MLWIKSVYAASDAWQGTQTPADIQISTKNNVSPLGN